MAYCDAEDIELVYPGLTTGIDEDVVSGLCNNASEVIDFYILSPAHLAESATKTAATVHQVAAYIETGNLQDLGLAPGTNIKAGSESFYVGERLCAAAKRVLVKAGLTRPVGA